MVSLFSDDSQLLNCVFDNSRIVIFTIQELENHNVIILILIILIIVILIISFPFRKRWKGNDWNEK